MSSMGELLQAATQFYDATVLRRVIRQGRSTSPNRSISSLQRERISAIVDEGYSFIVTRGRESPW